MMRKWLAEKREKNSLTQQQVAERVGVTRQTISAIENGTANPSVFAAKAIAEVLEFPWSDFFDNKGLQK